ncbi:MAG: dihydrolipoamide acetyltransferase family protein [Nocardioides sp.]
MTMQLTMPALSPTMEKGTLARWLIAAGDEIRVGDVVAEVETDKATMEVEADQNGWIARLTVAEGTNDVPVGSVIAILAAVGEGRTAASGTKAPPSVPAAAPTPTPAVLDRAATPPMIDPQIDAAPLARRIASARGLSLADIAGSGSGGRIVRRIVGLSSRIPMGAGGSAPQQPAEAGGASPPVGVPVESAKLSTMRRTIAHRLSESKRTVPHFYLTTRCNLDPLLQLRGQLNAEPGVRLSVNDMLIKALGMALMRVPEANVQYGGDTLHRFTRADIAMAVAIPGGLVTPVIRDAGSLSLSAIAQASRSLADRARNGQMTPDDYAGGTASLSNLGMYGIDEMLPVINPPQALILGIGAGIAQPWRVKDAIALATVMAVTGSFDHRAIDGAIAATLMAAFRELVQTPLLLCC